MAQTSNHQFCPPELDAAPKTPAYFQQHPDDHCPCRTRVNMYQSDRTDRSDLRDQRAAVIV